MNKVIKTTQIKQNYQNNHESSKVSKTELIASEFAFQNYIQ